MPDISTALAGTQVVLEQRDYRCRGQCDGRDLSEGGYRFNSAVLAFLLAHTLLIWAFGIFLAIMVMLTIIAWWDQQSALDDILLAAAPGQQAERHSRSIYRSP